MQSPALLIPSKQELFPPQTLEGHDHFFDAVEDPASGASAFSNMSYQFPSPPADFSGYQIAASSHSSDPAATFICASQSRVASQQPCADLCLGQYCSPEFDPNCPRTLSGISPGNLSDVFCPAGYEFSATQQSFCVPDHIYQEPEPRMEDAFSGLSAQDDCQDMDTSVYPTPVSRCLPYHDSPGYHPRLELLQTPNRECRGLGNGLDEVDATRDEPYSKLIYRALMETPGHMLVLRDIYTWFKRNTEKTDKETSGWKNSIRHNLSMNGAFEKVELPPGEDSKKGNMWRLTEDAVRQGVKSTTRYRNKGQNKRGAKHSHNQPQQPPTAQRQAAGSKGGHAARRSARQSQAQQQRRTEKELFESGLSLSPERPPNPEARPCSSQYMLEHVRREPHRSYILPHALPHGLPIGSGFSHHQSTLSTPIQQMQHSEAGLTALSPVDLADCQSFPHSPTQDQSWAFNTVSDDPIIFAPAHARDPSESLSITGLGVTPLRSPSLSDGDDPSTPTNNPGGLDVDPDGYLAPSAHITFFEAEGTRM